MWTKKSVSPLMYHFCNLAFYALCLTGLLFQVTLISRNYFRFDVIRDINVIMPEESHEVGKVLNACFGAHQILDYEEYSRTLTRKLASDDYVKINYPKRDGMAGKYNIFERFSVGERFKVSVNHSVFLRDGRHGSLGNMTEFMFGPFVCYRIEAQIAVSITFLRNITYVMLSQNKRGSNFEHRRMETIRNVQPKEMSLFFKICSYSYSVHRLEWPYRDDCVSYRTRRDAPFTRNQAILECINAKSIKVHGKMYKYFPISEENIGRYENQTFRYDPNVSVFQKECELIFNKLDCIKRVDFTTVQTPTLGLSEKTLRLTLTNDAAKNPSFDIVSKPRIDNIDFVTYILGALGSWLGFNFISINPVPCLLQIDGSTSKEEANKKRINSLERKLFKNEFVVKKMNLSMRKMEETISNLINNNSR